MKTRFLLYLICFLTQVIGPGLTSGQVLTHGPVVGGVTASEAKVFVRTDQSASVALQYGTDPNLGTYQVSGAFTSSSASDFTSMIPWRI